MNPARMVRPGLALVVAVLFCTGSRSAAFAEPAPAAATSASPDSCASAVPELPRDLPTAFAYDLDSPTILRFIASLAAVAPKDRKSVFESAVAAAPSAPQRDVAAAESAVCPTLDEIYGAARVSYLLVNGWQLKEFDDAKRFDVFSSVVSTAITALAMGDRLSPERRQNALLPFARALAEAVPSPTPSATGACAQPDSFARTRHVVEPVYPPMAVSGAIGGAVVIKVMLTETGDVRYVRVLRDTLNPGPGGDDVIKASLYSAAATTYWPGIEHCRPASGAYLFEADFHRK